tara:strand:- start:52 stop:243 length:192 start_codon:yes stop_codon:yes gene_type:complete
MFTEEQSKALLSDMVTIYNKINADLDNLKDKQQLLANLIQGVNAIVNPQEQESEASPEPKKKK